MLEGTVSRVNRFLREHPGARAAQKRLTRPVRRSALPIVVGAGRGLRVRFGDSALTRALARAEAQVEDAFLELLSPGEVVYDVGANIGWYSLLAARAVGASGKVVAFEPSLANAALLRENAATNRLANVTVIAAAVADHDGWATFQHRGSLEGSLSRNGEAGAQAGRVAPLQRAVRELSVVPVLALDSWIAATAQAPPGVVKIDVEGAEARVVRGMSETLRAAGPALVIELHSTQAEIADALEEAGYEHALIQSAAPTREGPGWAHVLARPRAHDGRPALEPARSGS